MGKVTVTMALMNCLEKTQSMTKAKVEHNWELAI